MDKFITVGKIVKPQGIKGDLKVTPYTENADRFKLLKKVYIDGVQFNVTKVSVGADAVFMGLFCITDRNGAELFRNKFVQILREDATPLDEFSFFIDDVMYSEIYLDNGEKLGELVDVFSSKTDVWTVKCTNGKVLRFPFLKTLLLSADVENKKITVKKSRLDEVGIYED